MTLEDKPKSCDAYLLYLKDRDISDVRLMECLAIVWAGTN